MRQIYLDHASTTPIDPNVLEVMFNFQKENYGNPSSLHSIGRIAKKAIEKSREKIALILGTEKDEIVFTSGGTEADNLAIIGIANAYKNKGKHIIVSKIEHKAVLKACRKLEKENFEVTYLDVDKNGIVSLRHLKKSIRPDTILVSIMYANNEIGTIQPIKKIAKILKESKIYNPIFHTDACQAVGALSVNVKELGVDAMTISSSKIYGPKGVGCLYLSRKYSIEPMIVGGGQEGGIRSGTENVSSIVGFAEALAVSDDKRNKETERLIALRDYFWSRIKTGVRGVCLNGSIKNRLPNNLNISISDVEGESLLLYLDDKGIYCSTGSACSSSDLAPSHVLTTIGVPLALAHCSIRFTLGRYTRKSDIDYAMKILPKCVEKIRDMSLVR
ncbi:MAG: cysteine desulfurase family protein [bacterium]